MLFSNFTNSKLTVLDVICFFTLNSTIILSQSVFSPSVLQTKICGEPSTPPPPLADIGLKTLVVLPPVKVLARSWGGRGARPPLYIYPDRASPQIWSYCVLLFVRVSVNLKILRKYCFFNIYSIYNLIILLE